MKHLLILIVFLGVACNIKEPKHVEIPPVVVVETPVDITTPEDYLTIRKCTNCSADQWKFIQESLVKVNETVASTCFASFMLERKLIQTGGLSNEQVVDRLVGKNTLIDVEMYYSLKRVLGYTLQGQDKIWINRKYMMNWNRCDLASLLGHETGHKKGFTHDHYYSPPRDYSVPYSINAAFKQCCVR